MKFLIKIFSGGFLVLLSILGLPVGGSAQTAQDTIFLKNGDRILGQIKELENGVLRVDVGYSDKDIEVNWEEVIGFRSLDELIMSLKIGGRFRGYLTKVEHDSIQFQINQYIRKSKKFDQMYKGEVITLPKSEVIFLEDVKDDFLGRLDGELSVGFNLAKENSLRQYSWRSRVDYIANWYSGSISFNTIRSVQDETDPIERTDGGITFVALIRDDWFFVTRGNFLSNSQQLVQLRIDHKIGFGKYLVHTGKARVSAQAGINFNYERFEGESESNQSTETVLGLTVNILEIGPFEIHGAALGYNGLTQAGRFRADVKFDFKYEFLDDFFIRLGTTYNFDNQPAEAASPSDYVIQSTLGWTF